MNEKGAENNLNPQIINTVATQNQPNVTPIATPQQPINTIEEPHQLIP